MSLFRSPRSPRVYPEAPSPQPQRAQVGIAVVTTTAGARMVEVTLHDGQHVASALLSEAAARCVAEDLVPEETPT